MRFALSILFLVVAANASSERLCPTGYLYSGDDTSSTLQPYHSDLYIEEESRTPTYSCYKMYDYVNDLDTWLSATHQCFKDEAQLASFEDHSEMERVMSKFKSRIYDDDNDGIATVTQFDVFTSGMKFNGAGWYWLGGNATVNEPIENEAGDSDAIEDSPRDCLVFRMSLEADVADMSLRAENCFVKRPFLCEARVQTITYYSWWSTNWVDILLGFLLVVLFLGLCISLCAYSSKGRSRRTETAYATRTPATRRDAVNARNSGNLEVIDLPPTYDSAAGDVRIHRPVSSLDEKPNSNGNSNTRYTSYKTRAGDMMTRAKVYIYRPKNNNSNLPA